MGGAPFGSNRWFCNVSRCLRRSAGRRGRAAGGARSLRVPSASSWLGGARRGAATAAGGAGGGGAGPRGHAPRCLAGDLRAWRSGSRGAPGTFVGRLADTRLASPAALSDRARPRAGALGRRGAAGLRGKDPERRGRCSRPHLLATGRARADRGGRGLRVIIMHGARSSRLQLFSLANPRELSGDELVQPFRRSGNFLCGNSHLRASEIP